jgi:hypothetical protein
MSGSPELAQFGAKSVENVNERLVEARYTLMFEGSADRVHVDSDTF